MPKPLRALIVEDSEDDARQWVECLTRAGYAVAHERVASAEAMRAALERQAWDLVISDYAIPGFDGLAALVLLRQRDPDLPFIAVSGAIGDEQAADLIKHGAHDFLLKDRPDRLGPAVRQALKQKLARDEQRRLEVAWRESEERYRLICESTTDAVFLLDAANRIQYANRATENLFGYAPDEVTGKDFGMLQPERFREAHRQGIKRFLETGERTQNWRGIERVGLHRDGREFPVEVSYSSMTMDGKPLFGGFVRDITERKEQQEKIARLSRIYTVLSSINSAIVRVHERRELFEEACRIAVEQGQFGVAWIGLLDPDTWEVHMMASYGVDSKIFDRVRLSARADAPEGQGTAGAALRSKRAAFCNDLRTDPRVGAFRAEAVRRGYCSVISLPLLVNDAAVGVMVLYAREADYFDDEELKVLNELAGDISFGLQYIEKEERLDYLAYYDALTGLPNGTLFHDRLTQFLQGAKHDQDIVAVLLIDLDRFTNINDTLGRHVGDTLLRMVADRLKDAPWATHSLARIGADTFAVAVADLRHGAEAAILFDEQIARLLQPPFTAAGHEIRISARAGIALYPGDGRDAEALFKNAEAALKRAQSAGERYLYYTPEINATVAKKLALEDKLRRAAETGQFELHYEPKVNAHSGRIVGLEALIRWHDPDAGLVSPEVFITALEETGLILDVGQWALEQALSDYRRWHEHGLHPPRVAVNVSPVQLRRHDFADRVRAAIEGSGVGAQSLEIEITENLILEDIEANTRTLRTVSDLGVKIAIDDFGTGYSSLRYLARLPVDSLKIDRSFIVTMVDDKDSMTIVSAVVSLAHALNLSVVAEGVESEEQSKFLKLMKCDEMQGYLYGKPVPVERIAALLREERRN